jgi:hypothetical protein
MTGFVFIVIRFGVPVSHIFLTELNEFKLKGGFLFALASEGCADEEREKKSFHAGRVWV